MDRPHLCTYCDRRFRRPEHLQRHIRTHTKEKPYVCHCGSSFARRDLLRRHERLAHEQSTPAVIDHDILVTADNLPAEVNDSTPGASGDVGPQPSQTAVSSNKSLPLPPEYHHTYSTILDPPTADDPLYDFTTFLRNSGLRQVARVSVLLDDAQGTPNPERSVSDTVDTDNSTFFSLNSPQPNSPLTSPTANDVTLANLNLSADLLRPYLEQMPEFIQPPAQSIKRYLQTYMQRSQFKFIHESIRPQDIHVSLTLAILALGAQYLFETRNATSLFNASRSIALKLWTSQEIIQQQSPHPLQLAGVFLLLSEFVKRDQPLALPQQLGVLQSGLIFSLGIHGGLLDDIDEVQFHSWAKAETNRRTETFGLSIALVQNFLLEFLPISLRIGPHVRFPCPPKIWDIPTAEEFKRHTESIPNTDGLSVFFETFLEGKVCERPLVS
ncbi:hypothetical protein EDB80DRAFT_709225 [Ilyonectria destructans]|nr:hypothetical protein EDB80DRAFT_709225 [Ilyonectria destructans]